MTELDLITKPSELETIVGRAHETGVVAIDTEFVWEKTYYPNLGLVQLGINEEEVYLIDPRALDITPLGELIKHPDVELVLHDATQDLQILARETDAFPANVFDTQRAAGFVGFGASRSLQGLLAEALGVEVGKGETRSDWLQRPLTKSQRHYAADDVRYLPRLRENLLDRVMEEGHEAWFADDRRDLDNPGLYQEEASEEAVHRVRGRGVSRLNGRQQAVLGSLAAWRENEARDVNRPRRHVLPDDVLVALAKQSTRVDRPTEKVRLKEHQRKRYADALERAITEGREADPVPVPRRGKPTEEDNRRAALVHLLRAVVSGVCVQSGIDERLVATKADLAQMVNGHDTANSPVLKGWRAEFLGDKLQQLLEGLAQVNVEEGWPALRVEDA